MADGQEERAQLVVKQIKREPTQPQFKRKGNEKQFVFNAQVNDSVQTAIVLLFIVRLQDIFSTQYTYKYTKL